MLIAENVKIRLPLYTNFIVRCNNYTKFRISWFSSFKCTRLNSFVYIYTSIDNQGRIARPPIIFFGGGEGECAYSYIRVLPDGFLLLKFYKLFTFIYTNAFLIYHSYKHLQ
jgi:hypothetical protein